MEYTFEKHGFQVFREAISLEIIEEIREFLIDETDKALKILRDISMCESEADSLYCINKIFKTRNEKNWDSNILSLAAGLYPLETRLSSKLLKILESKKLANFIQKCLKADRVKMHMPPAARFVIPNNTHGMVPAHNDYSYNKQFDDFIVVWVPLTDIGNGEHDAGGIVFYEVENIEDLSKNGNTKDNPYWFPEIDVSQYNEIYIPIKPGDVFVFNKFIVHKSKPNNSRSIRLSIDYRFFNGQLSSKKHSFDLTLNKIIEPVI